MGGIEEHEGNIGGREGGKEKQEDCTNRELLCNLLYLFGCDELESVALSASPALHVFLGYLEHSPELAVRYKTLRKYEKKIVGRI